MASSADPNNVRNPNSNINANQINRIPVGMQQMQTPHHHQMHPPAPSQLHLQNLQPHHHQTPPSLQHQTQGQPPSSAGPSNPKRGAQKPPARPMSGASPLSGSSAPATPAFKTTEVAPAARRKKRKAPEKQVPDRVAALLPESALYTQLLEFEARVDAVLARKKADIQEALKHPPSIQRTLRIYVFNTFANQNQNPGTSSLEPPSWTLRIVGRILEEDLDASKGTNQVASPYPKFSSFFKRVTVSLDPALYPENSTIVWDNVRSPTPVEGFEIKRKGDKEFVATIRLEMNYIPEKFKLAQPLAEVLGIEVDTRPRIIAALWQYVKAKKLQQPSEPSTIKCDPPLQKVFGAETIKFSSVSQRLSQLLSPPQPICMEHNIKLSGNCPAGNACYDVLVDVPVPLQKEMTAFLANTEKHKDIVACDEAICAAIKKIHEHRRRRAFYLGFSQSPVEFINALIASQSRDLKIVAGEASRNAEKEGRSEFYNQPWVEDAVIRYLNRQPASGNEAPGTT